MNSYTKMKNGSGVFSLPITHDASISDFVAIDLETTGLGRTEDIIEIGAIRVRDGKAVKRFGTLIRPRKPVPGLIEGITGISNEMLEDAPEIEEVLPDFLRFIGNDTLLGHNIVSFDSKFICREAEHIGLIIKNPLFDTLTYARKLKKQTDFLPKSLSLTCLCQLWGIERAKSHRAYDDALANIKVFYYLRALEKHINENERKTLD